ncbi:carbohydrate kinase family protein [Marinobacter halodurans]|uniref:Carbohydrate kinase family protein n=1 Tax=Marinobacter halodurans TaxID=2528979 RepID=A0ABY1ZED9_9GAMM|nr:carbohydrate kinase family protein [Marinobacter halodurans]TBW48238.1 carbohydrate kinase family protein [Marinobacter halodurans]
MTRSVLIVGGTSVDTIIHLDQFPTPTAQTLWPRASYRALGSTGAGKALNLAALGDTVTLHTLLGEDNEARFVREQLAHEHIHLLTTITPEPTEQHVNLMDAQGDRISFFVQPPPEPSDVDWEAVRVAMEHSDVVVINILAYTRPALALAKEMGKPVWIDLHDYDGQDTYHQPFIEAADVLFLSSDRLPDYRPVMEALVGSGKQFVVCTHGRHGATLLDRHGQWLEQPVFGVDTVLDTNGAGDAFFSGFLYGYGRHASLADCLKLAAAGGALCVGSDRLAAPGMNPAQLVQQAGLPL